MKLNAAWNHTPYRPADCLETDSPYICRLAPFEDGIELEWIDPMCEDGGHQIICRERQGSGGETILIDADSKAVRIENLKPRCDYEIVIRNTNGKMSRRRLFRTGFVPGTVVNYLHPDDKEYAFSGNYLCSPCLVRLPGGALLASMDVFQSKKPQNLTLIFRSDDDGRSWRYVTELFPCFWGRLFIHQGCLYMLAISTEYGDLLIGKSEDEGRTWAQPSVLARGACFAGRGFHRAPCAVLCSGGRIWTSLEYGSWLQGGFSNAVLSIDENLDLLHPQNWHISELKPREEKASAIEGNVIEAPDGRIINMLRFVEGEALLLKADASDPDKMLTYDQTVPFPMAHTKFEVMRHENGSYYAVGNQAPRRNILSLYTSSDLKAWTWVKDILNFKACDPACTAFQYPACLLEGDEILIASRTAFNGASTFHDNNYCTFHRVNIFE